VAGAGAGADGIVAGQRPGRASIGSGISFAGTGGNLLVLEQGYKLTGQVAASDSGNILELRGSAAAPVTVSFNGLRLTNSGTVRFGPGGYETLTIANSATLPGTIAGFTTLHDTIDLTQLSDAGNDAVNSFNTLTDVLTKDPAQAQIGGYWARAPLVNLGPEIGDFGDTVAVVDCLERVITVDTSVAHLAGAMGKEAWVMLPYAPDWRWLLDRVDSPWYPAHRLFRQGPDRSWDAVIDGIARELLPAPR
jgi:hypothetical protein